jgi:hypothetical protein
MLTYIMNLGMAVMAWSDTVIRSCFDNLTKFKVSVLATSFRVAGLQKSSTAAATKVVRSIRLHIYKVFLSDHSFDYKPKILGNGITKGFSDQLTRILNRKLNFQFLVPVRTDIEFSFPDPLGIVLDDAFGFKAVWNIEFFQSDPDCEKFMPSLGVEPNFATEIIHSLGLDPHNFFPVFKIRAEQAIVFRSPSLGTISPVSPHRVQDFP